MQGLLNNTIFFQSHRGGILERPENTMAAYRYSWNINGAIPEVDVRTTRDDKMVCIHDNSLRRTTNAPFRIAFKKIKKLTAEEIKKWDAGVTFCKDFKGEHVPTLSEAFIELRKNNTRQLYLDVKNLDYASLLEMIRDYKVEKQIIFVHRDIRKCNVLSKLYTDARTMTWLSGSEKKIKQTFYSLYNIQFKGLTQIQLHLHSGKRKGKIIYKLEKDFLLEAVDKTSRNNVQLMVCPFNFDNKSLSYLLSLGIRWFVIDAPERFVKIIKEISNKGKRVHPNY